MMTLPTDPPIAARPRPKWRLRVLRVLIFSSFGFFIFIKLDRSGAEWLSPVA